MFTDYYLQFDSQSEAEAVLYTTPEGGERQANYLNIDAIGVMYAKPPEPLPEGYTPEPIPGWHVNVRLMPGEDGAALEPFKVSPEPAVWRRVWA